LPIPTNWAPCPGKTYAFISSSLLFQVNTLVLCGRNPQSGIWQSPWSSSHRVSDPSRQTILMFRNHALRHDSLLVCKIKE